jgi:hypothetical protein
VLDAIGRQDVQDAIVRVLIALTPAQNSHLDEKAVRQALTGAHVVASVSRSVERGARTRLGAEVLPESLSPRDAVALYLGQQKLPPDRREVLLRYARAVIEGEEPEGER